MREINQANYNTDGLHMEVINAIAHSLSGEVVGVWNDTLDALLTADTERYRRIVKGEQEDPEAMRWAEEEWRDIAFEHGIRVVDDGEAGYTYIGSEDEIARCSMTPNEHRGQEAVFEVPMFLDYSKGEVPMVLDVKVHQESDNLFIELDDKHPGISIWFQRVPNTSGDGKEHVRISLGTTEGEDWWHAENDILVKLDDE